MKTVIIKETPENTPQTHEEFDNRCKDIEEDLGQVYERINENNKLFAVKCFEFIRDCGLLTEEYVKMLNSKIECKKHFACEMNPFDDGGVLSRAEKKGAHYVENIFDSKDCQRYFRLDEIAVHFGEDVYNVSNFWFSEYTPTGRRRNRPTKIAFYNKIREDAYKICFKGEVEPMKLQDKVKVLFVGYNNVLRSPMAEFVMKYLVEQADLSDKISVTSSGYGKKYNLPMSDYTKNELSKHEIPFDEKSNLQLTKVDDYSYNYIIAMDNYDAKNIAKIVGKENKEKIFLLLDFAGEHRDVQYVYNTYKDVELGCRSLIDKIRTTFNI